MKTRVLTGITTSGTPHLGNYVGAIRPTVRASQRQDVESYYFLADYHALIKVGDPARVHRSTLEIAATWLACGLNPEQVMFYRQSDIPEIPELMWLLTCVTGKGMLNRAHAYKAATDKNIAQHEEIDHGVSAGLFMYPVLMAADILMFNAHQVPVGRDQVQHLEMARDIASRFNHQYGEHFTLPEVVIEDHVATLPGLDGRKMSKSYDNTIALFGDNKQLQRQIYSVVTDSTLPGVPKSIQGNGLFQLYQAFANADETQQLAQHYAEGMGWGDIKALVYARLEQEIAPMRTRYNQLMEQPQWIENCLQQGAVKARLQAQALMKTLRHAVGLRSLTQTMIATPTPVISKKKAFPAKQYRGTDGLFYFKLVANSLGEVFQSGGYTDPKQAQKEMLSLLHEGEYYLTHLTQPYVFLKEIDVFRRMLSEFKASRDNDS